ncbi:hypothetical protein HUG17_7539 [Dermatophagoides farinae]|uniref:Uncharacterized protein n=1 Tax=Dermatophagoides farinae TaxID=6954 RepID=A0A9D4NRB0_DERFA|nr:hypothetical protein HUG17_7539 [Dermatophagoides farinae]
MQKLSTKVRRLSRQLSNIPQLLQNVQRNNQMSTGAAFVGLDNLNTLNLWRLNPATSSSSFINRRTIQFNDNDDDDDETKENLQKQVNERTIQFMSIVYAILLIIIGAMCTFFNISKPNNQIRDIFVIIISIISAIVICFFHYDIIKFRHWALQRIENERRQQHDTMIAYRYFRGRHANDFYLKIGMIVFCFGSITHIGIDLVKQTYFFINHDIECQCISLLLMESMRLIFSFYQLYFVFKYSNIIINRNKNLARFALMHLIGTSISFWFDTIIDDAIADYVDRKLNQTNYQNHSIIIIDDDADDSIINGEFHGLKNHILFEENCSRKAIISNESLRALPYLYPFTIEYNIILASIWYMIWSNIGKVKDRSLFTESYEKHLLHKYRIFKSNENEEIEDDNNTNNGDDNDGRRSSLLLTVDCHASNKGLFIGLAILLIILITVIIFFSTIHKDVSRHFGVVIYTLQILLLTLSCFVIIPIAYYQMHGQLDVVNSEHRNNSFMMMDDILIMIPLPFYFIHYTCSAIASLMINNSLECNNLALIGIDMLTIIQVLIQSPFIVDKIRRCSNDIRIRFRKPGRELVTLMLILNVTLWILNTLELKIVEEYHATHEYFGEFFTMILSHTTLPMMLFYRFHSSVCLSHIWKYAYEKDE